MPANLPPEYFKAEERYLQARTLEEKISATEVLIRVTPKHKGTEKLLRTLKRRMAKLKMELRKKRGRKIGRGGGPSFAVRKEGAAQVVLVGLPNSGKSKLLQELTSARPEVADHPFTTREPVPGMMEFEDVQIQLVEVPAIVEGSSLGKGLGVQPLSAVRNADAIALVADVSADPLEQILILVNELNAAGVRLNQRPPKITVQRRSTGGIEIRGHEMVEGGELEIKRVIQERHIHNAFVVVEEPVTREEVKEALDESLVYLHAFILLTKCDLLPDVSKLKSVERKFGDFSILRADASPAELKKSIYENLGLIRVYTKRPDEEPARRPVVLPRGSTILQVTRAVHKDFEKHLKFARVWGSAKFPGQQVSRDHVLQDKDVVELHV
ncbi:MAG TPA: TGS domain-containing protein [Hadesarchaea archaeon]|nr:TGS domain-containing protein [Hadesarchaea archaeon]